jgi:hypothetical protein
LSKEGFVVLIWQAQRVSNFPEKVVQFLGVSTVAAWGKNSTYPSKELVRWKKFIEEFYAFIS